MGNQTSLTYPDETVVTKTYDALGQLTKVVDAENQSYTYTYDNRGNLISNDKCTRTTTGMDWQNVATYVYDETNHLVSGKNEQGEYSL